jgi:hypothetical protein
MISAKEVWLILLFLDLFMYAFRIGRTAYAGTYIKRITLGGSIYSFCFAIVVMVLIYLYTS